MKIDLTKEEASYIMQILNTVKFNISMSKEFNMSVSISEKLNEMFKEKQEEKNASKSR